MAYENVLSALADPTRRAILELLREGPSPVGELAGQLPVTRAAVSQHLRVLREAKLVTESASGTRRIYQARPEGLAELKRYLEGFWGEVLQAYAAKSDAPSAKKSKGRKKR
jgi:DNA-binding transcriptional ArsR family regulator